MHYYDIVDTYYFAGIFSSTVSVHYHFSDEEWVVYWGFFGGEAQEAKIFCGTRF